MGGGGGGGFAIGGGKREEEAVLPKKGIERERGGGGHRVGNKGRRLLNSVCAILHSLENILKKTDLQCRC